MRLYASLVPANTPCFALRVTGEPMIDDGIFDGDLVIVRQQRIVCNGEIAVVRVEDEATVKRFYHEGDHLRLEPANATMKPIIVTPGPGVEVVGKVIGLVRTRF